MKKYEKQALIIVSIPIVVILYLYFLSPSAFEYRRNEKKLKGNYGIIRGQLIHYSDPSRGFGSFWYEFCIDSIRYSNTVSSKHFKGLEGKVGDTITIAYQLDSIENNQPIFVLFKNESIGEKYKHESE